MSEYSAASLSDLSAHLLANGFITRELDLVALFATTSAPATDSVKAYNKHQQRLVAEGKARDQVLKCLWHMLNSKVADKELVEDLRTRVNTMEYEVDRFKNMVGVEKRARENREKEMEGEKAKAKQAIRELTTEQERHRFSKEELVKAKNALQFVRTQVTHDNKRRDLELSKALTSLQRTTADASQSRFVVLNSSLPSSLKPTSILSDSNSHGASLDLLEDSLREAESARMALQKENRTLRELLGDVEEWVMEIQNIRGLSMTPSEFEEEEGNESMMIPLPHLSRPISSFSPLVNSKLNAVKIALERTLASIDERVHQARSEMSEELERERLGKAAEKAERRQLEVELEEMVKRVEEGERMVEELTKAGLIGGNVEGVVQEDSNDDIDVVVSPPTTKDKGKAVAVEKPRPSDFEGKRAQNVQNFLSDLGIDSPVSTAPALTSVKPTSTSTSSAPKLSASTSTSTNPARRPSSSSASSSRPPSKEQDKKRLSPLSEHSEPASSRSSVPSPFLAASTIGSSNPLSASTAQSSAQARVEAAKKKVAISSSSSTSQVLGANRDGKRAEVGKTTTTTTKKTVSISTAARPKDKENSAGGGVAKPAFRLKTLEEARGTIRGM